MHIQVLDEEGVPVESAQVHLPLLDRNATTGPDGRTLIDDLPLGHTILVVLAPGYRERPETLRLQPGNNSVTHVLQEFVGQLYNFLGEVDDGRCIRSSLDGSRCGGEAARIPAPRFDGSLPDLPPRLENFTLNMTWDSPGTELSFNATVAWSANRTVIAFQDGQVSQSVAGLSPVTIHVPRPSISEPMRQDEVFIAVKAVSWKGGLEGTGGALRFDVGASIWYEDPAPS